MSVELELEERLAILEAAVRDLQHQLANGVASPNWLDQIVGSFKDEPAFEEVLEYGRAFRQADRPLEGSAP